MSRSWTHSRESPLWRRLDPPNAARLIQQTYGKEAGAELLLRAFLEERDSNPVAAQFWLELYALTKRTRRVVGSQPERDMA